MPFRHRLEVHLVHLSFSFYKVVFNFWQETVTHLFRIIFVLTVVGAAFHRSRITLVCSVMQNSLRSEEITSSKLRPRQLSINWIVRLVKASQVQLYLVELLILKKPAPFVINMGNVYISEILHSASLINLLIVDIGGSLNSGKQGFTQ